MKIGTRVAAGFAGGLLVVSIVIGAALLSFNEFNRADELNRDGAARIGAAETLLLAIVNMETGLRGFVGSSKEEFLEPYKEGQRQYGEAMERVTRLSTRGTAQWAHLDAIDVAMRRFQGTAEPLIQMRRDATELMTGTDALQSAFSRGDDKQAADEFRRHVNAYVRVERGLVEQRTAQTQSLRDNTRRVLVGGGIFAVALGCVVAWLLARAISRPLALAVEASRRIAAGDLTMQLPRGGGDEIGALLESMREMQRSLTSTVDHVRHGAENVATASAQIAQGNNELSRRTEHQASSLQQVAASMERIDLAASHSDQLADQASRLAAEASAIATQGGETVDLVVQTMQGIEQASQRMADIIGVIDNIAFQTNILALNAAVEAASAGDRGRGFSVVAAEVRTLAQRSAAAAKEIKELISDSTDRVGRGNVLVHQAGSTTRMVGEAIQRLTGIVGEIRDASREQAQDVSRVSSTVSAMDDTTQQNAALVEESAAAARSLAGQARQLVQAVSVFSLTTIPQDDVTAWQDASFGWAAVSTNRLAHSVHGGHGEPRSEGELR